MTTPTPEPQPAPRLATSTDRRAVETRKRFIDAGWELLDELRLAEILRNIPVEKLAERAGRSERSFWNHFGDLETFVRSLLADVPRLSPGQNEPWIPLVTLAQDLGAASRRDAPAVLQFASLNNWMQLHDPEEITTFLRQILLVSRVSSEPSLAPKLQERYWGNYLHELESLYESVGSSLGVHPVPPLTWADLALTINSLVEGMQLNRLTAPENFPDDLASFVISLTVLGLTTAEEDPHRYEDRASIVMGPQRPVWADGSGLPTDTLEMAERWLNQTESARTEPSWFGIMERVGRSRYEVVEHFWRPEVLGALAMGMLIARWADTHRTSPDHDREVVATDSSGLTRRGAAWLTGLVEEVRKEPWCGESLLAERLRNDPGLRIREAIPLAEWLAEQLGEPPGPTHETICNVLLTCAFSDVSLPPSKVARIALAAGRD